MWWEDVTREFDLVKSEEKKNNYMGRSAPVIPCQAMGRWEGEGIKYGTVSDWWGSLVSESWSGILAALPTLLSKQLT